MKKQKNITEKSSILIYREVLSGYWKEWFNTELLKNTAQLRSSKAVCVQVLSDKNTNADIRQQLSYDHQQITKALNILNGTEPQRPFNGRIEPKKEKAFVPEDIQPFIIKHKPNTLLEFVLMMFISGLIMFSLTLI